MMLDVREMIETDDYVRIKGIASTPSTDRMGDVVEPMGAKFKTPMPLLWQHRHDQPVGHVTFAQPTKKGIPFEAEIPVVKEAGKLKERIDEAVQPIRYGLVEYSGYDPANPELSLVTIPANAEAVITAIKSIDQANMAAIEPRPVTVVPGVPGRKPARKGAVKLIERTYS